MSRTAIVTGAAGDLGSVIAKRLADEGYKVAITDLHSRRDVLQKLADAITSLGGKVLVLTGDVTMEQDVQSIIQDTVKAFGPLEVVGRLKPEPLVFPSELIILFRWCLMSGSLLVARYQNVNQFSLHYSPF